ncbi:ASCH domain-containing protein [Acinetobacter sp.]|uniref:ASCH domain-containing protein n=1 Tax=Acinetobacter sp. TaxID=472 RepID=UPI0026471832|nr:ASCH domain-containing protein [Acinetobacter sp.]MDN5512508.1 ASCH domain-containing protein [Acinetobacter sp.]MDN5524188.1 ASCH domain-containing protein [Acinetobacter sp.]
MQRNFAALSIVTPAGQRIAQGQKRLEIRSWQPEQLPLKDLVIVENKNYLSKAGDGEAGMAVAIVDIESVHPWPKDEIEAASATYWAAGYWAWEISNVRPIDPPIAVQAKRKIYFIEMDHA